MTTSRNQVTCEHCGYEIRQEYINDSYGIRRLAWLHDETGSEDCFDDDHQRRMASPDAECYCPYCWWGGSWDDCSERVIKQTMFDPEERYALCPDCGKEVEAV
jgi:hypothetical protein